MAPPTEPAAAVPPIRPTTGPSRTVKSLREILLAHGWVTPADISQVLKSQPAAATGDVLLAEALVAEGVLRDLDLVRALSEQARIPFLSEERLLATAAPGAVKLLTLEQVVMTTGERKLWADHAVAYLAADNSIQQVHASGNVRLVEQGGMEVEKRRRLTY